MRTDQGLAEYVNDIADFLESIDIPVYTERLLTGNLTIDSPVIATVYYDDSKPFEYLPQYIDCQYKVLYPIVTLKYLIHDGFYESQILDESDRIMKRLIENIHSLEFQSVEAGHELTKDSEPTMNYFVVLKFRAS